MMADNYNPYSEEYVRFNVKFEEIKEYIVLNSHYPKYFEEPFPSYFDKKYLTEIPLVRKHDESGDLDLDFDYETKAKLAGVGDKIGYILAIVHYILTVRDGYRYRNLNYDLHVKSTNETISYYEQFSNDDSFLEEAKTFYQNLLCLFSLKKVLEKKSEFEMAKRKFDHAKKNFEETEKAMETIQKELEEAEKELEEAEDIQQAKGNKTKRRKTYKPWIPTVYVKTFSGKKGIPLSVSLIDEISLLDFSLKKCIDYYRYDFKFLNPYVYEISGNQSYDKAFFELRLSEILKRDYRKPKPEKTVKSLKKTSRKEVEHIVDDICKSLYKFIAEQSTLQIGTDGREKRFSLLIFSLLASTALLRNMAQVDKSESSKVKYIEYLINNKDELKASKT